MSEHTDREQLEQDLLGIVATALVQRGARYELRLDVGAAIIDYLRSKPKALAVLGVPGSEHARTEQSCDDRIREMIDDLVVIADRIDPERTFTGPAVKIDEARWALRAALAGTGEETT